MSGPPCSDCHGDTAPCPRWREVSLEAAMLHDSLFGGGVWIAPGEGYRLPVCADCAGVAP